MQSGLLHCCAHQLEYGHSFCTALTSLNKDASDFLKNKFGSGRAKVLYDVRFIKPPFTKAEPVCSVEGREDGG